MDRWSRGRVALVGDAGYSPAPAVGGGTSLAVVGAYQLASELAAAGGDHIPGFSSYEKAMRPVVQRSRTIGPSVISAIIPKSSAQIWLIAQAMRLLPRLPVVLRRRLTSFGGGPAAMFREDPAALPDGGTGRARRLIERPGVRRLGLFDIAERYRLATRTARGRAVLDPPIRVHRPAPRDAVVSRLGRHLRAARNDDHRLGAAADRGFEYVLAGKQFWLGPARAGQLVRCRSSST